ncbi:hypothetical protein EST38_g14162 [Candolleomyces aberdarensis]|uniref:Uncharacterized protein n=1 Tax=Candolleomyces aberdarensis TaxID=2316362 RepID=A0A4Q2D0E5_9AGAR|nr:hypothetical protein EST38_g14162 [Candolleomyces aberdarensis]
MSGMKNSPFGKRLRASHRDEDDRLTSPRRGAAGGGHQRINSLFGVGPADPSNSTPALDADPSSSTTSAFDFASSRTAGPSSDTTTPFGANHSPVNLGRFRDYGDRFVPSRDSGDIRTSFHLLEEGGPSTPSKNRIIPSESDAQKGVCRALVLLGPN